MAMSGPVRGGLLFRPSPRGIILRWFYLSRLPDRFSSPDQERQRNLLAGAADVRRDRQSVTAGGVAATVASAGAEEAK